jgi:hypothetical protein
LSPIVKPDFSSSTIGCIVHTLEDSKPPLSGRRGRGRVKGKGRGLVLEGLSQILPKSGFRPSTSEIEMKFVGGIGRRM